jgi:DNA-binding MarR family transcriptional regulator
MLACVQASVAEKQATAVDEVVDLMAGVTRYLMTATGHDLFRAIEELDLSLSQIKIVDLLSRPDPPTTLRGVSDVLGLSLPAVSRAVDGLVKRGFVSRDEDPDDRRCKLIAVTARGRRTGEQLLAIRAAGMRKFVATLDASEREALAAGLRPLAERPEIAELLPGGGR